MVSRGLWSQQIGGFDQTVLRYVIGILTCAMLVWVVWIVMQMCYLCDDASITLNQVMRFTKGFGITWNSGERVQAFTHPLWFLVLSGVVYFTHELYLTAIIVSVMCSIGAFLLILVLGWRRGNFLLPLISFALMLCLTPVLEFTSSGLESPLGYLCAAGFILALIRSEEGRGGDKTTTGILPAVFASGLVMTRFDYGIIVFPVLLWWMLSRRTRLFKRYVVVGGPVIAWLAFSLAYFGLLFPCTYYAKIDKTLPLQLYLGYGLNYFKYEIHEHTATLLVVFVGVLCGLLDKPVLRAVSLGIVFYLAYIMKIGGDWIGGRMFAVPVFMCCILVALFCSKRLPLGIVLPAIPVLLCISYLTISPLLVKNYSNFEMSNGIVDLRGQSYLTNGLLSSVRKGWPSPAPPSGENPNEYIVLGLSGEAGTLLPDSVYHIDRLALCSPMMAFMPVYHYRSPGHILRWPANHLGESMVLKGGNEWLGVPELKPLFDDVVLATRKPLFDKDRVGAIWRLNFQRGRYVYHPEGKGFLYSHSFVTEYPVKRSYELISGRRVPFGRPFAGGNTTYFSRQGINIFFGKPTEFNSLKFILDTGETLSVEFLFEGSVVHELRTHDVSQEAGASQDDLVFLQEYVFENVRRVDEIRLRCEREETYLNYLEVRVVPDNPADSARIYTSRITAPQEGLPQRHLLYSTGT